MMAVEEGDLYVDEAFLFAGPAVKKLSHTKNLLLKRCFMLAFHLTKARRQCATLEASNKQTESQLAQSLCKPGGEEEKSEAKVKDLKGIVATLRKENLKMQDEIQQHVNELRNSEELHQAQIDEVTALRRENKMMQNQGRDMIDNTKEAAMIEFRRKEKDMASQFALQIELLGKEVTHYKHKCIDIESLMRNSAEAERKHMALQLQEERTQKMAERMRRITAMEREQKKAEQVGLMQEQMARMLESQMAGSAGLGVQSRTMQGERSQLEGELAIMGISEDDSLMIVAACERQFALERKQWEDQRDEQEMLNKQKDLSHDEQVSILSETNSELRETVRADEKLILHFRDLERIHMKQIKDGQQEKIGTFSRTRKGSAREEGIDSLQKLSKKEWDDLKHRSVDKGNATDPAQRSLRLLTDASKIRSPRLNETLLEDRTDTDKEWAVFGAIRELNQALVDSHAFPIRPSDATLDNPLYPSSFEFEKLYENFAHNKPQIDRLIDVHDDLFGRDIDAAIGWPLYDEQRKHEGTKGGIDSINTPNNLPVPASDRDPPDPFGERAQAGKRQAKGEAKGGEAVDFIAEANEAFRRSDRRLP